VADEILECKIGPHVEYSHADLPSEASVTQSSPSALDMMRRHVDALFTRDAEGRLLAVNDGEGGAAPRFFLGRTREGCLWRFAAGLPSAVARELEHVCRNEPPLDGDGGRVPAGRDEYLRILGADGQVGKVWVGPCYCRPTTAASGSETRSVPGLHLIDESNIGLLKAHLADWVDVAMQWRPTVVSLENGNAVSVCASVRKTGEAHEAGVDTAPAFRRRGFARVAVAGWLAEVNRIGAEPLYSTSWENEASQRLAATLALTMFGVDFHVT